MVTGVPENLLGLTKIWGCSAKWAHGGTHADNVGAWFKDIAGLPFNVNYNGKTWQQDVVLWCRMTGDAYNPALDPYGTVYPAPAGNYVPLASLAALDNSCKGCDTAAHTGQLFLTQPSATQRSAITPTFKAATSNRSPKTCCVVHLVLQKALINPRGTATAIQGVA